MKSDLRFALEAAKSLRRRTRYGPLSLFDASADRHHLHDRIALFRSSGWGRALDADADHGFQCHRTSGAVGSLRLHRRIAGRHADRREHGRRSDDLPDRPCVRAERQILDAIKPQWPPQSERGSRFQYAWPGSGLARLADELRHLLLLQPVEPDLRGAAMAFEALAGALARRRRRHRSTPRSSSH